MKAMLRAATAFFLLIPICGSARAACETQLILTTTVAGVIDGHTVRLDDGTDVRLIGALAPQTPRWWKKEGAWPPAGSARRALENLIGSSKVELRFAPKEEQRDRHERYLAQMFVLRGEERIWAQGHMISAGLAQAYSFKGHRACARSLQEKERNARAARSGLWRKGHYKVLPATDIEALSKRGGSFQLVEGTVLTVGKKSQWTFLNFSSDWRTDFTVAIRAGDRRAFQGSDVVLETLEGKKIRVRGWIERWNGPVIKATHPEQIEVLEQADGAAR